MKKNIIKIGIILALVAVGIAIMVFMHFQFSLYYSKNVRVEIYLEKTFSEAEIMSLVKEILPEQKVIIETSGAFKDTISLTTTQITDEQLEQIVSKLNETYGTELTVSADTLTLYNSNVRGRDIFAPYLVISTIAVIIIVAIITLFYRKNVGAVKTVLTSVLITFFGQFFFFVILSLTGVEINRVIPGAAVAIFIFSMVYLMSQYEKIKEAK